MLRNLGQRSVLGALSMFRRPQGLAARAVVLTVSLVVVTAALCAMTLLYGAHQESARHQRATVIDRALSSARISVAELAAGDFEGLSRRIAESVTRGNLRLIQIRDETGGVIIEHGVATERALASRAVSGLSRNDEPSVVESRTGLAAAAPLVHEGVELGSIVIIWKPDAFRFDALRALAPFLLIAFGLVLGSIPLTVYFVQRAAAPLEALRTHAARIAEQGVVERLDLKTGDEFETLANAMNAMTSRLDESMRRIQEIAFVDPGTQLPNLDRFLREIDFSLLQHGGRLGLIAVFELKRLPRLRQSLDAPAARDLTRAIAEHLVHAVRTVSALTPRSEGTAPPAMVARIGEDEFSVFVPFITSPTDAGRFAQHINAALNLPFAWRGHRLSLGAVCGVALAPRDGGEASVVLRRARLALGAAHAAPGMVRLFTPALDREVTARLTLEREMRGALERNEFRAYFQPKVNLATGQIEACEALARWIRPDRTIVGPGRFIPLAEESGLIGPLSEAILREACWKAAAWSRAGYPIKVAVNVSALQFRRDRFAENVLGILQHAGLPPEQLELEITESVALEDPERAVRTIKPLRDAGVRFAIDDFGCGHSSLSALSKLPFDVIKIDQQFVRSLARGDRQAAAIVEMILALARSLGMEIVAEGVERQDELDFMRARGCHWAQGFLSGAAMAPQEFAELLRRQAGEEIVSEDAA
jgi:EAL domain-containing protein (putative c-di-GMP-specific phosphodiesterase class I)/GGDEF domain-containing protein